MTVCDHCGSEIKISYICNKCKGHFCVKHKNPENHNCPSLTKTEENNLLQKDSNIGNSQDDLHDINELSADICEKALESEQIEGKTTSEDSQKDTESIEENNPIEELAEKEKYSILKKGPMRRRVQSQYYFDFNLTTACEHCGSKIQTCYTCIKCRGHFCVKHKNPEDHNCSSLTNTEQK